MCFRKISNNPVVFRRSFNGQPSTKCDDGYSPEERQRLGTEDSGFGGETASSGVNVFKTFQHLEPHQNGSLDAEDQLVSSTSTFEQRNQFEFSDDESLFSSGYGISLDLPDQPRVLIQSESQSIESEDFGFESINKSDVESEMRRDRISRKISETRAGLLASLCIGSRESSGKSSATSTRTGVLTDSTSHVNEFSGASSP